MTPILTAIIWLFATAVPSHDAEDALVSFEVAEDVRVTLFASEPMMSNPTSMDIDARGRVWICEVHNYRRQERASGDRILVLEDTDSDGKADRSTVFFQGKEVNDAQGICVLDSRVLITCPQRIWIFHDDNGDDVPDRRETLFTSRGPLHDHGLHALTVGPDGRLYGNCGNATKAIQDRDGKTVIDTAGNPVDENAGLYIGGMAFRCDMDGSNFEVLGHNFRNPYELTVDAFGTVWQTDNDDDGNRGVRINMLVEYGNYGYLDERTRARWPTARTGMSDAIPLRHWHQNDPGTVPNLLQTGGGSPTGMCIYEGDLLPNRFHGSLIQCDAGPHVVRLHPLVQRQSAYQSAIVDVVNGARDPWFRPTDVCVAPDGSFFVSDWYDPIVGGHDMKDTGRGRIFRVAPRGDAAGHYRVPEHDLSTARGAITALESPSIAIRHAAGQTLRSMGTRAAPELREVFLSDRSARMRARALWILGGFETDSHGKRSIERALIDSDPQIRIVALRLARQKKWPMGNILRRLVNDPSMQVRRECAIALRHCQSASFAKLWAALATQHRGQDRWYLESLGIGAHGRWDACIDAWLPKVGDSWNAPAGRDIIWRSRSSRTAALLAQIIQMPELTVGDLPRYFRAFDFQPEDISQRTLLELARSQGSEFDERTRYVLTQIFTRLDKSDVRSNPELAKIAASLLETTENSTLFVDLVRELEIAGLYDRLVELASVNAEQQLGVDAIRALLDLRQGGRLRTWLTAAELDRALTLIRTIGLAADARSVPLLEVLSQQSELNIEIRREAARALAHSRKGALLLVQLARTNKLADSLRPAVSAALQSAPWPQVQRATSQLFPVPPARDSGKLPPLPELLAAQSYAPHGAEVFRANGKCADCHVVRGEGKNVGPDLSEIGSKLSREALFESILYPSSAISHGYESRVVVLTSGDVATGLLVSETASEIAIKSADAIVHTFDTSKVVSVNTQTTSLMPADLTSALSEKELVDLVAYLVSLRSPRPRKALRFEKSIVDSLFRSEGVGIADLDNDGDQDIVVGDLWYEAPNWNPHEIRSPRPPERAGYTEVFGVYPDDYDGDGDVDVLVIPFHGKDAKWYENPGPRDVTTAGHWTERLAFRNTGNEARLYTELFETGRRVFLMGVEGRIAWAPAPDDPTVEPWPSHAISSHQHPAADKFAHGLGVGDINGDGRNDVISTGGWWEQPENGRQFPFEWTYHAVTVVPDQAADMVCFDADLDGRNDVLCTSAHGRGVYWCRQIGDPWGPTFETHRLDESIEETHALNFVDVDGDGKKDLVTGRRFFAHGFTPERADEPSELAWYEIVTREGRSPELIRYEIDDQSGVGTQFVTRDIDGDGRTDMLVSNRKGVFLFQQR